jgi:hypothetical protein
MKLIGCSKLAKGSWSGAGSRHGKGIYRYPARDSGDTPCPEASKNANSRGEEEPASLLLVFAISSLMTSEL